MRDPQLPAEDFLRDVILSRQELFDSAALARWAGAPHQGDAALFSAAGQITIHLPCRPPTLSRFNQISLRVDNYSDIPLLVGLRLLHGDKAANPKRPPTSFSGGREGLPPGQKTELHFPQECFGVYGNPEGWQDLEALEIIFGPEKTAPRPEQIRVALKAVTAECRRLPPGPRLTEAGLRENLFIDVISQTAFFPETPSPAKSWLPYGSDNSALLIAPPHSYPRETADEILAGHIMGEHLPLPISWGANPRGELEWGHFLHRHHFMRTLVRAYAATGNESYVAALDRLVESWIIDNPVPLGSNGGGGPAWETLSIAWRLWEWLWIMGLTWACQSFRPATKALMLRSIWEQATSLLEYQGHPNNWLIVESAALALAGLCLPEFHQAGQWRETGLRRLEEEFHRQFWADGVHFEISPLYHGICLHALLEVKEAAQVNDLELPAIFGKPLEHCFEYLIALCRPDFTWPAVNDSGGMAGDYTALLLKAGEVFQRPDLLWVGSRGRRGRPPAVSSQAFPCAGLAIMRSGYEADANYLLFRAGPPGLAHIHSDVLSLEVAGQGTPCLVDPGISRYAPGDLTDYFRSAAAHNMMLIDGAGPDYSSLGFMDKIKPAGKNLTWSFTGQLEMVTGVYSGPWESGLEGCTISRTVVFVRRQYWIVRDLITGQGRHEVRVGWQFAPGQLEPGDSNLVIDYLDNNNRLRLRLIPITGSVSPAIEILEGSHHPLGGWISRDGRDCPAPQARFTWKVELPFTLVWVLLPVT